jgi:AcrR family transcriptional regulator
MPQSFCQDSLDMPSREMSESRQPRRYRKRARARQEEQTRLRITEAAVELHRTVGPARATVKEIAERAGVGRMTVYNHFRSDHELLAACSSHYMAGHPPPDPAALAEIDDPDRRLDTALRSLYAWYRETRDMTGNALRDAPLVPALDTVMKERFWPLLEATADALAAGRRLRGARRERVRAGLRVALDFATWQNLTAAGLDDEQAAELAARFVGAAGAD